MTLYIIFLQLCVDRFSDPKRTTKTLSVKIETIHTCQGRLNCQVYSEMSRPESVVYKMTLGDVLIRSMTLFGTSRLQLNSFNTRTLIRWHYVKRAIYKLRNIHNLNYIKIFKLVKSYNNKITYNMSKKSIDFNVIFGEMYVVIRK